MSLPERLTKDLALAAKASQSGFGSLLVKSEDPIPQIGRLRDIREQVKS